MTPEEKFDALIADIPGAKRSNMFGVTCAKIGRRPFMLFYEDEIACKLYDAEKEEATAIPGSSFFSPKDYGKAMTNWVRIPFSHANLWEKFAVAAFGFVEEGR